jgi:hypothetical protein
MDLLKAGLTVEMMGKPMDGLTVVLLDSLLVDLKVEQLAAVEVAKMASDLV